MFYQVQPHPIYLKILKNLYQFIAEQMGITLQNTTSSVNIKKRLDFSCAIFNKQELLVANAPYIFVHLGSMNESVKSLIKDEKNYFKFGNLYFPNKHYNGGTYLPNIAIIIHVFVNFNTFKLIFYVAFRSH
jgi:N-methylhydantoinase B/oxoprolinase/acetone carboxylase alpha subunit